MSLCSLFLCRYPKSELTRIAAVVAEKSKAAACAYAEGISLSDRPLPHDLSELRSVLSICHSLLLYIEQWVMVLWECNCSINVQCVYI
jgi:hypothetical protein